jgi:hypothetical protein
MKKFLTLVLALVLILALSVPTMAFTSDTSADDDIPYSLKIYLVDYDDNDLFGIAKLPESDRGYAKNEIVAAVVELNVPDDEDIFDDGYKSLDISGDNVTFNVTDNDVADTALRTSGAPALSWKGDHEDGFKLTITSTNLPNDETYKWLVFAKVTDDEASLTAKLIDGDEADDFNSAGFLAFTLEGENYTVEKTTPDADKDFSYIITVLTGDYEDAVITIDVDKNNVSKGMSIEPNTADAPDSVALGVNTKNELGIVKNAVIKTDGDEFDDVMDVYNDVVVDVFGMDYMLIGNYVRDSYFEGLTSSDTIVATVDIEPWTAYVTVPDNIVVDPPKTGDAASIMGFVMVALSGAGVVALRKRG